MSIKLNGSSAGSVSFDAPADTSPTGTDVTLTLPTSAGSAGQYLRNSSTAGTLEFGNLSGVGKILNAVTTTNTDEFRNNSTSYGDLFSASITPSSVSSKILIFATLSISKDNNHTCLARVVKQIGSGGFSPFAGGVGTETNHDDNTWWNVRNTIYNAAPHTVVYLDSPSTTDTVTYKVQAKSTSASYSYAINHPVQNGNFQYESPVMSTITLLEVGA